MFQILGFITGLVGLKSLKKLLLIPMAISIVGIVLSFYYFIIQAILSLYNQVSDFLALIVNNKNSSISDYIYNIATSLGLFDGLYAGLPFVYSSLIFVLVSFVYKYTIKVVSTLFYFSKTFLE